MTAVTSPETANDSSEALIQVAGVKPSPLCASVHSRDHQPTLPGLINWYVAIPRAQATIIDQRDGARTETSQPRRPPKQKKSTASTPSIGTKTDPISVRKPE